MMRRFILTVLTMLACVAGAAAQSFPSRPVTLIVPFAAGGPSDTVARVVAQGMSQALGQSVIVENVAGAAGTIAAARVARAAPDGYTLAEATWSTHVVSPVVYQHLSYDVLKDFAPVVLLTETPEVLLSKKAVPANDLQGLIAWLKANPNTAFQGVAGGTDEVAGYFFKQKTGTQFQYVPYRGLTLAMQDLVAGRIDLLFDQPSDALSQISAGNIKAYAIMADHRLPVAPEIPTVDEAGLPGVYLSTPGKRSLRRTARPTPSSQSSTPLHRRRWPIRPCASGSPPSPRKSCRAISRPRPRSPLSTNQKPTNGGRSSRPPASKLSNRDLLVEPSEKPVATFPDHARQFC